MFKVYSTISSLRSEKFDVLIEHNGDDNRKLMKKIAEIEIDECHIGFCLTTANYHESIDEPLKMIAIPAYMNKFISDFNAITVIIRDTKFKRNPVLRRIEIYGIPSAKNSSDLNENIYKLYNATSTSTINENKNKIEEIKAVSSDTVNIDSEFKIPEEFLDSITQDILNLPYVLPSGAVVDETTLQKHKRYEEIYGRLPSDPFTWIPFSPESCPKFEPSLKMRLDEFKMKNSHEIEIRNSGRSIGKRLTGEPSTSTSGSSSHLSKKIKICRETKSLEDIIQSIYRNNQISIFTKPSTSNEQNQNLPECFKCKKREAINLYKILSCNHIFCKTCLTQLNSICLVCSKIFENKNVEKINL